jgi:PAS domain S-box-containing protein
MTDPVDDAANVESAMLQWAQNHGDRGALTTDTCLRVRSWNSWLVAATGVGSARAIGQPLLELFPSLVERGLDQAYKDALTGQVTILSHSLHRFILPSASRTAGGEPMPQRGQISPLTDKGRIVGTLTIVEDVSERVATERELRARIAAAERARATAEAASRVKDEFLATLSHEIRTPLNAVLGWTQILRSREFDRATVERAVEVIDRNATAQLTLISDMLDMARIATGKVRLEVVDLDLASIVASAMDAVRPAAAANNVTLTTEFAPGLPTVRGDRDRLLQVVWNLLSNAVKFTDANGQVTVRAAVSGGAVRLIVADTGHGIAAPFLPQVFERFKQADASSARRHGGLGLGLALVRELVEMHGGTVKAESPGIGLGSTFTIMLPLTPANKAVMPSAVEKASARMPSLGGIRILVVEDEADAREIIVQSLTDVGATVTAVTSVSEALAALRGDGSAPADVVVTDIGMPGHDGYDLLQELRKLPADQGGRVPAIAVTAYATVEDRRRALDAGFVAHIAKPFAPGALIATIARAVARRA